MSEIAELLSLHPATVRGYIHDFNESGFQGLEPASGSGRKLKIKWTKEHWEDLLAQKPSDIEKLQSGAQNWNQELICLYFSQYEGITVSQGTVSKSLKAAKINWNRARLRVHSPDPHYVIKRERVEGLRQMALTGTLSPAQASHPPPEVEGRSTYLVYFDAADLHWCPDTGNTYVPCGEQLKVDSPGKENPWYALFGSLVYPSGDGHYTIHDRKRSDEVVNHLQGLIERDPDGFWFVILDNASAHHTDLVNSFVNEQSHRLELVFLPTYSPHLNLIERLWKLMRGQVTKNNFFASLQTLAHAVQVWLEKLSFGQFCSLLGIDENDLQFV